MDASVSIAVTVVGNNNLIGPIRASADFEMTATSAMGFVLAGIADIDIEVTASSANSITLHATGVKPIEMTVAGIAKILGEDWTNTAVGTETWTDATLGSEVWTIQPSDNEGWLRQ